MRTETIEALTAYARQNKDVILLTADLGFSVLESFRDTVPDQFMNVGVSEQAMIGIAAGLALSGHRVVVYSIANFPTLRCLEQIRNDVCYHDLPVTIIAVGGGLAYGTQGYTHHGIEDLGIMSMLPNMTVACPADPVEAISLVPYLLEKRHPAYLRLGRAGEPIINTSTQIKIIDRPILLREGSDIAFLATGPVLSRALDAAKILAGENISSSVYSFPIIRPFDENSLHRIASEHRGIVTLEEHNSIGGFGTMIADWLMRNRYSTRFDAWGITPDIQRLIACQSTLLDALPLPSDMARALL